MAVHLEAYHGSAEPLRQVLERAFAECGIPLTRLAGRAQLSVVAHNGSPGAREHPPPDNAPPWLDVVVGEHGGRVGPFSCDGLSLCSGCVAAHEQSGEAIRPLWSTWTPDPALTLIVAGLTIQALRHEGILPGEHPVTWSCRRGVVEVDRSALSRFVPLARHPHCGCTWADFMLA